MPKRSIRSRFLAERKALTAEICATAGLAVQRRLLQSRQFRGAGCLALYSAIHNEVHTDAVARQALALGKTLAYPRVAGDHLEFVRVQDPVELVLGAFGVLEPKGQGVVPLAELDLIVVPGVAFDRTGHRLGYGRGYYDRALAACREDCLLFGFAYDSQVVASLPTAQHDRKLSFLVTESDMLDFSA